MIAALLAAAALVPAPPALPPDASQAVHALHSPRAPEAPRAPQDDEEIVDRRPEIKAKLDELASLVKGRGESDAEAIAVIDQLLQEFPDSGPRDRAAIVDGLSSCLDQRRRELEGGIPDNRLYLAAAVALGEMGTDASKALAKWIGHKRLRGDLVLQRRLVLSLGKTKDTKHTRDLTSLLNNKDAILVAAAAEALANFADAEQKVRKDLFEDVLKGLMSVKGRMDSDPNDIEARQRYDTVAAPMVTTLQALSGHDERVPEQWQRWWNKSKKDDWDEERS